MALMRALAVSTALLPNWTSSTAAAATAAPLWLSWHRPSALQLIRLKGLASHSPRKPREGAVAGGTPPQPAISSSSETASVAAPPLPLPEASNGPSVRNHPAASIEASSPWPEPQILEDSAHPIRDWHLTKFAWAVLLRLRTSGHEAFVVGGTVRDILLRRRPKDYDILTSADPQQVASLFSRALVLGRAFPICHVHQDGAVIEVSSLSTGIDAATVPRDAAAMAAEKKGWGSKEARERRRKKESQKLKSRGTADGGDGSDMDTSGDGAGRSGRAEFSAKNPNKPTWGDARRLNAQKRDFTVNGLLYDPFARLLFDYVGGIADCEARTLRTLGPAMESFTQDPARMLRAVRIAARAGLDIEGDTAAALGALGSKVATLKQGRLQMELAAMMAHGAASKSVQLLWRFGLLELLLPHHAVLLKKSKVPRSFVGSGASESTGSVLLFDVLAMMDTFAQAHEPLDTSVWVAIAAAPLIAAECKAAAKQRRARARRAAAAAAAGGTAVAEPAAERSCGGPGEASPAPADKSNGTESAWGTVEEDGTTPSAAACTAEYLEAYGKIVDKVMLRLLSPVDAKTQRLLLPAAEDEVVTSSASKLKHGDQTSAPRTGFLLLACLLPRQAVETAADMLKMEAELRGGPLPEALPEGNRRARRGRKRGASKRTWLSRSEATVLDVLRRPEVRWGAETDLGL